MSNKTFLDQEYQLPPTLYPDSTYLIGIPGSGKTRCLTAKATNLIKKDIPFVALTFTVKAARELKERMPNIEARTIHSLCLNRLRGRYRNYLFKSYNNLLEDFLNLSNKVQYPWILIDECQDLNWTEVQIIQSIMADKIFAVGDIYQSIYDFPGANALGKDIEPILTKWNCKHFPLVYNYRSSENIIKKVEKIYKRDMKSPRDLRLPNTNSIAILARTNKEVDLIDARLIEADISFIRKKQQKRHLKIIDSKSTNISNVTTMTAHCCKGLEFNKVYIKIWKSIYNESRLHYVAASRAVRSLKYFYHIDDIIDEI